MTKSQIAFPPPIKDYTIAKMKISAISFALFCALNSAIATDLECNNGNCTYSDETTTTSIDLSTILDKVSNQDNITNLTINTPNANLTGTATDDKTIELGNEGNGYPITITTKELKMTGKTDSIKNNLYTSKISTNAPLIINAHLNITETSLQIHNTLGTPFWEQYQFEGNLIINGNFTAKDSNIQKNVSTNTELQNFIVSGKSDITNTTFIIYSPDKNDKSINTTIKQLMLTSNGGFNGDITTSNTAQFKIRIDTTMLENTYGEFLDENSTEKGAPIGGDDGVVDKTFSTKLELDGNKLYAVRKVGKGFRDLELAKVTMDLEVVNAEIQRIGKGESSLSLTEQERFKELPKVIEAKQEATKNQTDEQIAESYNQKVALNMVALHFRQ